MTRSRHHPALRAAMILGVAFAARNAHASELPLGLPADATLTQLIHESLAVRPELSALKATGEAAQHRQSQSTTLADPSLQVSIQNDGFTSIEIGRMETSWVSLMASQTFPWPGTLALRHALAGADVDATQIALRRAAMSTEAEVRRAYLNLVVARDRLALLKELEAVWQKSLGIARARYESGEGAQSDFLRAQLEQNRLTLRRLGLVADETLAVENLNRLRQHPLDEPIVTSTNTIELKAIDDDPPRFDLEAALVESPEVANARLTVVRAQHTEQLAKKAVFPDFTIGAGLMYRGTLPAMWQATLGAPVPIFAAQKQHKGVEESRARSIASQHEVASIEQLVRLRTAERKATYTALRETISLYQRGLLVQSKATAESTLAQYQVGKVAFASVLEANAGFIADQENYLLAQASAHRVVIAEAERSLVPGSPTSASPAMPSSIPGTASIEGSRGQPAATPAAGNSGSPPSNMSGM